MGAHVPLLEPFHAGAADAEAGANRLKNPDEAKSRNGRPRQDHVKRLGQVGDHKDCQKGEDEQAAQPQKNQSQHCLSFEIAALLRLLGC